MTNEVHDYIEEKYGDGYSVVREEYGEHFLQQYKTKRE